MAGYTLEQNLERMRSHPATQGKAGDVEQARLPLLKAGYTWRDPVEQARFLDSRPVIPCCAIQYDTSTGISTAATLNRLFTRLSRLKAGYTLERNLERLRSAPATQGKSSGHIPIAGARVIIKLFVGCGSKGRRRDQALNDGGWESVASEVVQLAAAVLL